MAFPRFHDDNGIEAEIASLRRELAALKKSLARRGDRTYAAAHDQASELYDDLQDWLAEAMPHLRSRARAAGRAIEDNSTAIIVGAAVVGLLAALLFARR